MVHTMEAQEVHWSSYHASARDEESEIVAQFLAPYPYQNDQDHQELGLTAPTMYWSDHAANSSACHWPQGDSNSGSTIASTSNYFALHSDYNNHYLNEPNVPLGINTPSTSIDLNLVDEEHRSRSIHLVPNPTFIDQIDYLNEENISDNLGDSTLHATQSCPKRKFEEEFIGSHKKKAQASTQVQENGKKAGSKMAQRSLCADEEESNTTLNRRSSSSYRSDNDSNCSQEKHGAHGAICHSKGSPPNNLNGKTRAGRGSDTDPQSLYARKRRERINERLKILQNLVPNGTKVDVSTMLEDAVQYVKFLQLQIKLLSSDELWMYAPIAYNGMNIGINLTISPPQQ